MHGKYIISEFSSTANEDYLIEIYKENHTGTFKNITAGAVPVIHSYNTDDPKAPVKGSSLKVTLVSEGNLSIDDFAGATDTTFICRFYHNGNLKFIGYQVLEDFSEDCVDFNHEVVLTFTDNLGILKDVSLLDAARRFGDATVYVETTNLIGRAANYRFQIQKSHADFPVGVGDTIVVEITEPEGVPYNGTYLVTGYSEAPSGTVTIVEVSTFISLPLGIYLDFPGKVTLIKPYDLSVYSSLAQILRLCLRCTDLQLEAHVFSNIRETTVGSTRFLDETYIRGDAFQQSDNWKNCYDVLKIIMERFKCTLMQVNAAWYIVRVPELRYYNNDVPGWRYDYEFQGHHQDVYLDEVFSCGLSSEADTFAESAPLITIQSAVKKVVENFDYNEPTNLVKNGKLQYLGALLNEYPNSPYLVREYEALYWTTGETLPHPTFYIRVLLDPVTLIEADRYLVIEPTSVATAQGAKPNAIEIRQGDSFNLKIPFFITPYLTGFSSSTGFQIRLTDGTTNYYLNTNKTWQSSGVYTHVDTTNGNWFNVDIQNVNPAPITGLLYIYLPNSTTSGLSSELWYKDIEFKPVYAAGAYTLITGQRHTDYHTDLLKNAVENDIQIDDSPRNNIQGTLAVATTTSLVRDLTQFWKRSSLVESKRLGNITTFEELFWRRIPRYKLEGNWFGLIQGILSLVTYYDLIHGTTGEIDPGTGKYIWDFDDLPDNALQVGDVVILAAIGPNDGTYTIHSQLGPKKYTVEEPMFFVETNEYALKVSRFVIKHLHAATLMKITYFPGKTFMWGSLSIDYRNNKASGMLWEMWRDSEKDSDLRQYYEFKYLYETK